jgi:hypothetical protein
LFWKSDVIFFVLKNSRRSEKYVRYGRELNWPEGAVSKESIRAVRRLPRLRVCVSLANKSNYLMCVS